MGYILILLGVILSFKGYFYFVLINRKNHLLDREKIVIFMGKNIKNDLIIGKIIISVINGFCVSLIINSFLSVFFYMNLLGKIFFEKIF